MLRSVRSVTVLRGLLVGVCLLVIGGGFLLLSIADRRGTGMVVFSVSCLAAGVAIPVLSMAGWRRRQAHKDDGAWILETTLRRTRTVFTGIAVLLLGMSGLMFGVRYLGWDPEADELGIVADVALTGFLLVFGLVGLYMLVVAARMVPLSRTPVLRVLRKAPHEMVWVYQSVSNSKGRTTVLPGIRKAASVGEQAFITVCLRNGSRHTLSVECDSVPAVVAELTRVAPHAKVGYDHDTERRYRDDPASRVPPAEPEAGNADVPQGAADR